MAGTIKHTKFSHVQNKKRKPVGAYLTLDA